MSDFFDTRGGNSRDLTWANALGCSSADWYYDRNLRIGGAMTRFRQQNMAQPASRVLLVGIEVPSRKHDIHRVVEKISAGTRHSLSVSITAMGARGKFANVDAAIAATGKPLSEFDWLVVTDDDITFAPGFLDELIGLAAYADLSVSQPAHAFRSHTSYTITRRHLGSLVRRTNFVEIGPLTLIRADAFQHLIPFPDSRWCYGIDLLWTEIIKNKGLKMGIVDATPVRHLRPVANSYSMNEALQEGRALLTRYAVRTNRAQLWEKNEVILSASDRLGV